MFYDFAFHCIFTHSNNIKEKIKTKQNKLPFINPDFYFPKFWFPTNPFSKSPVSHPPLHSLHSCFSTVSGLSSSFLTVPFPSLTLLVASVYDILFVALVLSTSHFIILLWHFFAPTSWLLLQCIHTACFNVKSVFFWAPILPTSPTPVPPSPTNCCHMTIILAPITPQWPPFKCPHPISYVIQEHPLR